jgi:hypothetical protein
MASRQETIKIFRIPKCPSVPIKSKWFSNHNVPHGTELSLFVDINRHGVPSVKKLGSAMER